MPATTADLLKAGRTAAANQKVARDHAHHTAASLAAARGRGPSPAATPAAQAAAPAGGHP